MLRAAGVLAVLLLSAPDDKADLQGLVDKFFTALAAKDTKAILDAWSAESTRRESFQPELEAAAKDPSATPPTGIQVQIDDIEKDEARVTIRFKGKWSKDDESWTDEPVSIWMARFHKENGKWKWWDLGHACEVLAQELVQAPAEKHKALLEAHRELATSRMVDLMIVHIDTAFTNGHAAMARGLAFGAVEVADFTGRKDLQLRACFGLGSFLVSTGRPGESKPSLERARDLAVELKNDDLEASSRVLLGLALLDDNAPDAALRELVKAREVAAKHELDDSMFLALLYTAMAHEKRGALDLALRSAREALAFAEAKQPGQQANALESIARVQWRMSDYGDALATARLGLKRATDEDDNVIRAKLLNTEGLILQATADYAVAREKLGLCVSLYLDQHLPRLAGSVLNNIGMCYWEERNLPKAEETYREALKILEDEKDFGMAYIVRNNLGLTLRMAGNFEEAIPLYRASYEYSKTLASPSAPIIPLTNLGEIFGAQGEVPEALKLFESAVDLADRHGTPFERYAAHLGVGRTCARRSDAANLARAVEELRKAASFLETSRSGLRDAQLQQGFLSRHAPLYSLIAEVNLRLSRRADAFAASEEAKGRTLVDLLGKGTARISKSMTPEESAEEARLDQEMNVLTRKLDTVALTDARDEIGRELATARESMDVLRQGLALRLPQLETARGRFSPATLATLNKTVLAGPRKTALVSYLLGQDQLLIFVVLPGKDEAEVKFVLKKGPMSALQDLVEEFWSKCAVPTSDIDGVARQLYDVLFQDVAPLLSVEHLVIIPDGLLNGIPFHALKDPKGRYVIEQWSVSYAPSASSLVKMEELAEQRRVQPPSERRALLAVGSPAMPPGYGDLPGAKKEAEAVGEFFKTPALTGVEARKSVVKAAMQKARLVLLSTHGKVDEASPLYSNVVLAPDPDNNGRLHAWEIANLDLKADLVVLSACDTGLGRKVRGEGVVGLTWALFAGGTPSSVVALWQVADDSTAGLIQSFFGGVGTADPRPEGAPSLAQCLQTAQLRLLRDGKHAHPYYWAPFILVGHAGR